MGRTGLLDEVAQSSDCFGTGGYVVGKRTRLHYEFRVAGLQQDGGFTDFIRFQRQGLGLNAIAFPPTGTNRCPHRCITTAPSRGPIEAAGLVDVAELGKRLVIRISGNRRRRPLWTRQERAVHLFCKSPYVNFVAGPKRNYASDNFAPILQAHAADENCLRE